MSMHARNLPTSQSPTFRAVLDPHAGCDDPSSTDDAATTLAEPTPSSGDRPRSADVVAHTASVAHTEATTSPDHPWYRTERWLAVQLLALVPILAAMFAPREFRLALSIVGGTLITIGTVMLLTHKPTGTLRESRTDSSSA